MDASDEREWQELVERLRRVAGDVAARRRLNEAGFHVLPASYHAAVPTVAEVERSFEYAEGQLPFADEALFDPQLMSATLDELTKHAADFAPPVEGDRTNPAGFFWANPMFTASDAMAYYCMIRRVRPKTVVEVGSGFSSLVALEALRANGNGKLVCIEPYPREFLKRLGADRLELVQRKVEEVPAAWFNQTLAEGDLLFIDSTHTVRTGNDCVHLFLRVLPRLERAVNVHVHDIFLPLGYPKKWLLERQEYWNEQYLLHALLTDNPRAEVVYGTVYHRLVNPGKLDALMGGKFPVGGSSFWFRLGPPAARSSRAAQFDGVGANVASYLREDATAPVASRAAREAPPVAADAPVRDARTPIAATSFDAQFGVSRFDGHIGSLDHGDWVRYPRVDFGGGATRFFARLAAPAHKAGQVIEVRVDGADGPLLGRLTVGSTGAWETFAVQSVELNTRPGVHDLYLCFRGYYGVANVAELWFE